MGVDVRHWQESVECFQKHFQRINRRTLRGPLYHGMVTYRNFTGRDAIWHKNQLLTKNLLVVRPFKRFKAESFFLQGLPVKAQATASRHLRHKFLLPTEHSNSFASSEIFAWNKILYHSKKYVPYHKMVKQAPPPYFGEPIENVSRKIHKIFWERPTASRQPLQYRPIKIWLVGDSFENRIMTIANQENIKFAVCFADFRHFLRAKWAKRRISVEVFNKKCELKRSRTHLPTCSILMSIIKILTCGTRGWVISASG